jgi:hypothetical protein
MSINKLLYGAMIRFPCLRRMMFRRELPRIGTGFFTKLDSDLRKAKSQMDAFSSNPAVKRIVYVIINFDDGLHEYSDRYQSQIDAFLKSHNPVPEIEVRLDIKPPFYGARG